MRVKDAVRAGDDGGIEVVTGVTVGLADAADRTADRSRDVDSRSFADRYRTAVAAAESDRLGELVDEEVTLGAELRRLLDVVELLGLGDQLFELGEAPAIGVLGRSSSTSPASPNPST